MAINKRLLRKALCAGVFGPIVEATLERVADMPEADLQSELDRWKSDVVTDLQRNISEAQAELSNLND